MELYEYIDKNQEKYIKFCLAVILLEMSKNE